METCAPAYMFAGNSVSLHGEFFLDGLDRCKIEFPAKLAS